MYLSKVTKYLYFVTFHHCRKRILKAVTFIQTLQGVLNTEYSISTVVDAVSMHLLVE